MIFLHLNKQLSSGDELVEVDAEVKPWQIRRSNSYGIEAALQGLQMSCDSYHLLDELEHVRSRLAEMLRDYDILILSGGVSMGKFDFIPQALKELGVEQIFHKVSQRPGKPLWFGKTPSGKVVFALPGNPVSTLTCLYRYVLPWLRRASGEQLPELRQVALSRKYTFAKNFTLFLPVKLMPNDQAEPVAINGSGDYASLCRSDGFVELPAEMAEFPAGFIAPFTPWEN